MKYLLSFAIGAILGDIFFHLLPESIDGFDDTDGAAHRNVGVSVVAGIFMFVIVEMVLQRWSNETPSEEREIKMSSPKDGIKLNQICDDPEPPKSEKETRRRSPSRLRRMHIDKNNNESTCLSQYEDINESTKKLVKTSRHETNSTSVMTTSLTIDPAGYLNLIANAFDNFTHGLAIGASFLVGLKVGLLTTFVIIIHEIPHEICDYAILVNSGFSRWDAVKAQSSVSLFGILGTAIALYVKSIDKLNARTSWILPFSAGGFLYIALVTLLPDILDKETNFQNSLGQIGCVILGILFMGAVALF